MKSPVAYRRPQRIAACEPDVADKLDDRAAELRSQRLARFLVGVVGRSVADDDDFDAARELGAGARQRGNPAQGPGR